MTNYIIQTNLALDKCGVNHTKDWYDFDEIEGSMSFDSYIATKPKLARVTDYGRAYYAFLEAKNLRLVRRETTDTILITGQ